ncbi:MAG TPA: hypothetical protein VIG24_02855 [Acidimicrobiia bacterium]
MTATIVQSGDYTLEIDTGAPVRGFRLDDATRGVLDGTTFVLDGVTDFADVTDGTRSIRIRRGRRDIADQFGAGSMTFVLDDTAAGGVFNPFATDSPYYDPANQKPGIAPMRLVRLYRESELLFVGRITDFDYDFGLDGDDSVTVTASDDFYLLAQTVTDNHTTSKELTGARIEDILDLTEVNYPTGAARSIATGTVEVGGGGDYNVDLGQNVLDYLRLVNEAEQGRLFIDREGVLVFENRIGATLSASVADFHDDGTNYPYRGVDISFGADKVVNLVFVQTINNKNKTASDAASQSEYFVQSRAITASLLDTDADAQALADYLLNPQPEATFTAVEVAFAQLSDAQRDVVATIDIGDTITIEKSFLNGAVETELAQELAVEGVEHYIDYLGGHVARFYTSPTTIVYELILDDATYGVLDALNVLG